MLPSHIFLNPDNCRSDEFVQLYLHRDAAEYFSKNYGTTKKKSKPKPTQDKA